MTTSRYERIIIWIIFATLAIFAVACIFWIPYDQSKLLRPIPANAVVISSHHNLGPRLGNMATNIFFKSFLDSDGTPVKNLRENRYAARILASRLIIMAYLPDFSQFTTRGHAKRLAGAWSSSPAFVITAWVGGWTPILRWALWIRPPGDIMPLGDYNGHRLWTFKKPISMFGPVKFLSFAINEGVFVGCLSQDRNDIAHLMRIYDGRRDSILNEPRCRIAEKAPAADQVWLRIDLPYAAQNKSFFAVGSLDALENDYLAATIRFEPDIYRNNFLRQDQYFAEIGKMSACLPSIVALFPSDMVVNGLNGLISPAWAKAIEPILAPSSGTNNLCLLTVFTGDYGGKFGKEPFRIAVPTVLLAVSGCRQEQTRAAVLGLLDLINAKHRLGLILNSALPPAGQCPVFGIEPTSGGILRSLSSDDQPAFAFYNDWFLLAGNGAGLRKLLISFQSQTVTAEMDRNFNPDPDRRDLLVGAEPPSRLREALGFGGRRKVGERRISSHRDATPTGQNSEKSCGRPDLLKQPDSFQTKAFIRIDPGEGGKVLRLALTASIIMLNTDDRNPSNQNTIKILKAVRSWLEGISGLKNCAAWMESENGKLVIRLEIGRKN